MTVMVKDWIRYRGQGAILSTSKVVKLSVELVHLVLQY